MGEPASQNKGGEVKAKMDNGRKDGCSYAKGVQERMGESSRDRSK